MTYRGEERTDDCHGMHAQGRFVRLQWCSFYSRRKQRTVDRGRVVGYDDGMAGVDGYMLIATLFGIHVRLEGSLGGDVDGKAWCHGIVAVEDTAVNPVAGPDLHAGRCGDHGMERREEDNHRAGAGVVVGAVVSPDFVEGGNYYSALESIVCLWDFVSGGRRSPGIDTGLHHLTQWATLLEPHNSVHLRLPLESIVKGTGMDYPRYTDYCRCR